MTVELGQATLSPDPLASQRTELIGQLVASQFAIEAALAALTTVGGDTAVAGEMQAQLSLLSELRQQIGSASGTALTALRNDVTAAAGSASSIVQQARNAANAAGLAASEKLLTAQQARHAIRAVGQDLFDRHVLDPYLQFASEEDEKAYRKREEERRIAYERELAKHTEEGDRRAAEIIKTQLLDAKAHGADASPDFASLLSRTEAAATALNEPRQAAATPNPDADRQPPTAARVSVDDNDVDAITAALKATGIVITRVSHEPIHGVPERSRVAAAATTAIGG